MPTKKVIKEFIKYIQSHDYDSAIKLLDQHDDLPHATCTSPPKKYDGQSLLQIAFRNGAAPVAVALIEKGADVNFMETSSINEWNTPVLHDAVAAVVWATMEKNDDYCEKLVSAMRLLLERGADPNGESSRGSTPFRRFLVEADRRLDDSYVEDDLFKGNNDKIRFIREVHDLLIEYGANAIYQETAEPVEGMEIMTEKAKSLLGI